MGPDPHHGMEGPDDGDAFYVAKVLQRLSVERLKPRNEGDARARLHGRSVFKRNKFQSRHCLLPPSFRRPALAKEYRFIVIDEDPVLGVQADRPRQGHGFRIPPRRREHLWGVGVIHGLHGLLDNRAFVEVRRDVVRRRPNQLNPPLMGLMVGLCALKARQEGSMPTLINW